jgi:hypothetical protein
MPINGDGVEGKNSYERLTSTHEKIVHGGGHHGLAPDTAGEGTQDQGSVHVRSVVGDKNERTTGTQLLRASYPQSSDTLNRGGYEKREISISKNASGVPSPPLRWKIKTELWH